MIAILTAPPTPGSVGGSVGSAVAVEVEVGGGEAVGEAGIDVAVAGFGVGVEALVAAVNFGYPQMINPNKATTATSTINRKGRLRLGLSSGIEGSCVGDSTFL